MSYAARDGDGIGAWRAVARWLPLPDADGLALGGIFIQFSVLLLRLTLSILIDLSQLTKIRHK